MIVPVLLSGGSGTRLWPVSRKKFPKQFSNLLGTESLFQASLGRIEGLKLEKSNWIIICNETQRYIAEEQAETCGAEFDRLVLEPCSRNTAPAITLAALESLRISDKAQMLIQTSDHLIKDNNEFCRMIENGVASKCPLLTFGIKPNRAATGYGYIKAGKKNTNYDTYGVEEFVEKPSQEIAQDFFCSDQYMWNSGMFLFDAHIFLEEVKKYCPSIFEFCSQASENAKRNAHIVKIEETDFSKCQNQSVDHAVLERSRKISVLPSDISWSDIGTWDSVCEEFESDDDSNVFIGNVVSMSTHNTFALAEKRLVSTLGVKNLIIVETEDALLVAHKQNIDQLKNVTQLLQDANYNEVLERSIIHKPWGHYKIITKTPDFQIKYVVVKPHHSLSLQKHSFHSENWIVINGKADVINGGQKLQLLPGESAPIPAGQKHRLSNTGYSNLTLIQIQTGRDIGEGDIFRFQDIHE